MLKDLLKGKCRDLTPKSREAALSCVGYDVIVERVFDYKNSTSSMPIKTLNLVRGSFAELKAKLEAGEPVSGYIRYTGITHDRTIHNTADFVAAGDEATVIILHTVVSDAWGHGVRIFDNDRVLEA